MTLHLKAQQLSASYSEILLQANSLAHSFMAGAHSRKMSGFGHEFWQHRPFLDGDDTKRIDWRQSAKRDDLYLREKEWETIQKIAFYCERHPSFSYSYSTKTPSKEKRSHLLILTLCFLLKKSGEHFSLIGSQDNTFNNTEAKIETIANDLEQKTYTHSHENQAKALPFIFGDFLHDLKETENILLSLSNKNNHGYVVQILDRSECTFPFKGRITFKDMNTEEHFLFDKSDSIKTQYLEKFNTHQAALKTLCHSLGYHYFLHITDTPAEKFLLDFFNIEGGRK